MADKLRVGVIMGGISQERDVSLHSGRTICDHLDTKLYDTIPLFHAQDGSIYMLPWHFLYRGKVTDFEQRLAHEANRLAWDDMPAYIDFLYGALHGTYGEDGSLQGMCEVLGIPYLGSGIYASASTIDKWYYRDVLARQNITCPPALLLTARECATAYEHKDDIRKRVTKYLQFPLIVKPRACGSSLGVSFVSTSKELIPAITRAAHVEKQIQDVIIESYIAGTEICQILIPQDSPDNLIALPPTEIVPEKDSFIFDYDQKYMPGRAHKYTPARCSDEQIAHIQNIAQKVQKTLCLRTCVRIDCILAGEHVYVIDINTFPGTAPSAFPFLQAAELGMNHTHVINKCITVEAEAHGLETSADKHSSSQKRAKKKHVAVLLGGSNHEREVSLESGRNVCYKLSPHTYEVTPVLLSRQHYLYTLSQRQLVRNSIEEIEDLVDHTQRISWHKLATDYDFVFIALHGGIGENGAVQATLSMLHIPYNGSGPRTSALCMDKYHTHQHLKQHGFHVPEHHVIKRDRWRSTELASNIQLPAIIKPRDDGSSMHVYKVREKNELWSAIEAICSQSGSDALIENIIPGMELTVGVIGNETAYALPPSYTVAQDDILSMEEKFLPGAGENQTPAPLSQRDLDFVRYEAEQAYQALGCQGYARIDCFYQNQQQSPTGQARVVFLEPNTLPALTPATCLFHQAAEIGLRPMEFCEMIIELGFLAQNPLETDKHLLRQVQQTYHEASNFHQI